MTACQNDNNTMLIWIQYENMAKWQNKNVTTTFQDIIAWQHKIWQHGSIQLENKIDSMTLKCDNMKTTWQHAKQGQK